jgi:CheY-like chemotaxis protein
MWAAFARATMAGVAPTVLIVDDHADFRALARSLLEAAGYEVVGEAHDGMSALAAARALRPGFVLLDIQLPDADGFAVCKRLGAQRSRPGRPRGHPDFGASRGARGWPPADEHRGAA